MSNSINSQSLQIGEIKKMLQAESIEKIPELLPLFRDDSRQGVKNLVIAFEKKYSQYLSELQRLESISVFENEGYENGFLTIGGIDEVGRGPLAGPVVAAVVILKRNCKILGINDSKKLSAVKRQQLSEIIKEEAIDYSIGVIPPSVIDEINILQGTYRAMQMAISGLKVKPQYLLVDAVKIPNIKILQKGIIQGDAKSISIGAASIVAKVERDAMMEEYHKLYPEYGFDSNKGYGSAKHIEMIKEIGICPIHRASFVKNFI